LKKISILKIPLFEVGFFCARFLNKQASRTYVFPGTFFAKKQWQKIWSAVAATAGKYIYVRCPKRDQRVFFYCPKNARIEPCLG